MYTFSPMRPLRFALGAVALWMAAGGCSDDLPAASFIDKLRVLAVRAEPPEVAPGEETALDLLAVEPPVPQLDGGAPRPLSAVWLACALPPGALTLTPCGLSGGLGDGGAAPPTCKDAPDAPLCVVGTDLQARYAPAADALGGAAATQILLTVAVADTDGGAVGCLYDIANNGGRPTNPDHCVVALKRLAVSHTAAAERNHNPTLANFSATPPDGAPETFADDGGVWVPAPGKDEAAWDLIALRSGDAAERKPDGTYEALTVSWFTTAGRIDGGRSIFLPDGCDSPSACAARMPELGADTTWYAPTAAEAARTVGPDGRVQFWAVIRDDRGGVGWRAGALTAAP